MKTLKFKRNEIIKHEIPIKPTNFFYQNDPPLTCNKCQADQQFNTYYIIIDII